MKVAVTAATGGLGSSIIHELKKFMDHDHIFALCRTPEKAKHQGVEVKQADYNHYEGLLQGLEDIDVVLLVSGMDAPDKRIVQHRNVIEAARVAGVGKIVYTSIFGSSSNSPFDAIVETLQNVCAPGDVLVVMGAGPVWKVAHSYMGLAQEVRQVV